MAYTLADYRGFVRDDLEDTSYDADIVDRAINAYIFRLANKYDLRTFKTNTNLSVIQGDYEVSLPANNRKILNLIVTSSSPAMNIYKNEMIYNNFMENHPDFASATQQDIGNSDWCQYGNSLRFSASSNAAATIYTDYIKNPTVMSNDTDVCEINDAYFEMITVGAKIIIMRRNEDYDEAAEEERTRLTSTNPLNPGLETVFLRNESGIGLTSKPTVINTRRSRGAFRVDRDF